jgi:transposase-like protein
MAMRFPLTELLDEQESYNFLLKTLHPAGLKCKHGHALPTDQKTHDRSRDPIFNYRCRKCGNVFNIFTETLWQGTQYDCRTIVLVIRGIVQGTPTLQLADELELDYSTLLERRHRLQKLGLAHQVETPLPDEVTEGDEMFQNAGEKGTKHADPDDPPRRRANKRRGKGTKENDRPPVAGLVGRETGQIRLKVCDDTKQTTIQPQIESKTEPSSTLYTDESNAYNLVAATGRGHGTVSHSKREWARDDDGDGIREVHCNTMEGIWTGLRNFLRPFRGVHKNYLAQYVAIFEWSHNLKRVSSDFLRTLMVPHFTYLPT